MAGTRSPTTSTSKTPRTNIRRRNQEPLLPLDETNADTNTNTLSIDTARGSNMKRKNSLAVPLSPGSLSNTSSRRCCRGLSTLYLIVYGLICILLGAYLGAYVMTGVPGLDGVFLESETLDDSSQMTRELQELKAVIAQQKAQLETLGKSKSELEHQKTSPSSLSSSSDNATEKSKQQEQKTEKKNTDVTPIYIWPMLPSSDVWCRGRNRADRICRFRNLCYNPATEDWFIVKTNKTILDNVPEKRHDGGVLELGTVTNHPYFAWTFEEVSPFEPKLQNIPMRYEEDFHFLFKRLHPRNIMHNLHDDILGMYFLLKEFMGQGSQPQRMPFSLDKHRIMLLDPYTATDSSRPFQYLSTHPLRFHAYLTQVKDENIMTCFRDAVVGNTKLMTWYQYGFEKPQGAIENKTVNGLLVREVAEWYLRRIGLKLGVDENVGERDHVWPPLPSPKPDNSHYDFPETDLIVILSRKGNRLILNEEELAQKLSTAFQKEAVIVSNEHHKFEEQIKFLRRARIVVGMHGSILAMTMFCRRGTVIIEMFPFAVPSAHYTPYKSMTELPGMSLIYRAWENKYEDKAVAHPDAHPLNGGIDKLSLEMQEKIKNTKTVPVHKCCTSPFWLYRIYQDTIVTIQEVIDLIHDGLVESRRLLKDLRTENIYYANVTPPIVKHVRCLNYDNRPPGTLWAAWDIPWTGFKVDRWNVLLDEDGREFATDTNTTSVSIGGFQKNETVRFFIRPLYGGKPGKKGDWGTRAECVV